jgi:hypothetical protein
MASFYTNNANCLDSNGNEGYGASALMWPCNSTNPNQRFHIEDAGGSAVYIKEGPTGADW